MSDKKNYNIAIPFRDMARAFPDRKAVVKQSGKKYKSITFAELEEDSSKLADGFTAMGITKGTRTLVMVKPGIRFVATTFGLFKAGAVPVFIDPGMGIRNLLNCILQVECEAFIGIRRAHMLRLLFRKHFNTIKYLVTVGAKWFWGGTTHGALISAMPREFEPLHADQDDTAAIIFTTGSTGLPKGVTYTHGMFNAQLEIIRDTYLITPEDVDLSAFPLFALFAVALGMRSVIPDMNPTTPAKVNPQNIINAVRDQKVSFTFGSPAIWSRVSDYCVKNRVKLPTLKQVLMAGAPVANQIHERLLNGVLPNGAETHTPYGATESLPISNMAGSEVLTETGKLSAKGEGICVGRELKGSQIKIIEITDRPILEWDSSLTLPIGEKGEVVVKGAVVSREYFGLPEHNRKSKIYDKKEVWHRMGDVGYFDEKGRLWFCGRKGHRVTSKSETLFSVCSEAIFNNHPAVFRSALVGLGERPNQRPVIIIELAKGNGLHNKNRIKKELLKLGSKSNLTNSIEDLLFYDDFPTDIRHNAKIFREKLKVWAEKQLPNKVP